MADPEDFRYAEVYTFDLGLQKEFSIAGNFSLGVSADLFNVFSNGVVLERDNWLSGGDANYVLETLIPRIWRLGVRLIWR